MRDVLAVAWEGEGGGGREGGLELLPLPPPIILGHNLKRYLLPHMNTFRP